MKAPMDKPQIRNVLATPAGNAGVQWSVSPLSSLHGLPKEDKFAAAVNMCLCDVDAVGVPP